MNDLFTLLTLRDEIYAAYENAKKHDSMRPQRSGLQATLSLIEQKIQAEVDFRDNRGSVDTVLSPTEWENMA